MEIHLINSKGTTMITPLITTATLSGEYRSACRTLDLGIVSTPWDISIPSIDINLGDIIGLLEDGQLMFYGIVWSKDKNTTSNELNIHCKDYGIYLIRNRYNYKFKNMTPEAITKKLCGDFGIATNSVASVGGTINRNFMGCSLYDIIMTAYTLSNSGEYMIRFVGKELNVIKKGAVAASKDIEKWSNLISSSAGESLDAMINTVYVVDNNNKLIDTLSNKEDLKYGVLSDLFMKDDKKDYKGDANKLLKGIDYKISVMNFGNISYITGNHVIVEESYTGLKGKFYIDADTHTWKNGIYTNKLTLNYKNLMDSKSSGSEENNK